MKLTAMNVNIAVQWDMMLCVSLQVKYDVSIAAKDKVNGGL
jgi:hypothetical protein